MNPLTTIPARVRTALYWVGYIVGVLGQGITIVWGSVAAASPTVEMPLWLVITSAVLGLAQTQLNLLAGSNVSAAGTVTEPPAVTVHLRGDELTDLQRGREISTTLDTYRRHGGTEA